MRFDMPSFNLMPVRIANKYSQSIHHIIYLSYNSHHE